MSTQSNRPEPEHNGRFHFPAVRGAASAARLSDADRRYAASIVALGCDRSTAGKFLGLPSAKWNRMLADDPALAAQIAKAEVKAEIHYMKCVHDAAEEPKNYRGSIWWLERMRPDVYHRREADVVPHDFLEQIAEIIGTEVRDDATRNKILAALQAIARA